MFLYQCTSARWRKSSGSRRNYRRRLRRLRIRRVRVRNYRRRLGSRMMIRR
jgi:hypothetical protein